MDFTNDNTLFFLLIMFTIWFCIYKHFYKSTQVASTALQPQRDFIKDMEPLMFLIENKLSNSMKYQMETLLAQKKMGVLKDETIIEAAEEITESIVKSMSLQYINTLCRYFNGRTGTVNFIGELVFTSVLSRVLNLNDDKLRMITRARNFQKINEANSKSADI
jgi:hypothetical protein